MEDEQQIRKLVLDSFAVIAFLRNEPGHDRVSDLLQEAAAGQCQLLMSYVNLGEVLYNVERDRGRSIAEAVLSSVEELPIQFFPADRSAVLRAAHLKARLPIAYGDIFALALAQATGAAVVTGDPEFEKAAAEATIEWLPRKQRP